MPRTEARLSVRIWQDSDFLSLSRSEQGTYAFLISQQDVAYTGVIGIRARRWATKAAGLTLEGLWADFERLATKRFLVIDEVAEEILVRTFMRNDKVYKQPNILRAAADQLDAVESPRIRATLAAELRLIAGFDDLPKDVPDIIEGMLAKLGNPSPDPSGNPFEEGSTGVAEGGAEGVDDSESASSQGDGATADGQQEIGQYLGIKGSPETSSMTSPNHQGERGVSTTVTTVAPLPLPLDPDPNSSSSDFDDDEDEVLEGEIVGASKPLTLHFDEPPRADVERLCRHLAAWVVSNGSRKPTITKKWRDSARLMLDRDERPLDKAMALIDWCQQDDFWKTNILSMPTFRKQYDQLRLKALEDWSRTKARGSSRTRERVDQVDQAYEDLMAEMNEEQRHDAG